MKKKAEDPAAAAGQHGARPRDGDDDGDRDAERVEGRDGGRRGAAGGVQGEGLEFCCGWGLGAGGWRRGWRRSAGRWRAEPRAPSAVGPATW